MFDETDAAGEAEADARAEADLATGQIVSHSAMKTWLSSWGTPEELPPPLIGD